MKVDNFFLVIELVHYELLCLVVCLLSLVRKELTSLYRTEL